MRVLLDTNVVLDVILQRRPLDAASLPIMVLAEQGEIDAILGATSLTTAYYILRRSEGNQAAHEHLAALLGVFQIASVNRSILLRAVQRKWRDFEDAVLHELALAAGADAIITRNVTDFKKSQVQIYSPERFIEFIKFNRQRH